MPSPTFLGATPGLPPQASQVNQFLATHPMTVVYNGAQKDHQATAGTGATNSNGTWIGQQFTAGSSYTSGRVSLTFAVTGSPAPLVITLRPDNSGAPSATVLATVTVPNSFVPGSPITVSMPLSASITSGSVYWIVAQAVGDVSNFYSWSKSNQVAGTSTSSNGTSWTAQAYGSLFKVWDTSTIPPLVHTWEDSGARWTTLMTATGGQLNTVNEYTAAQNGSYVQSSASYAYTSGQLTGITQNATVNQPQAWSAARSGLLGDTGAVNASAEINQFLGAHNETLLYQGNAIVTPDGGGAAISQAGVTGIPVIAHALNAWDRSQPFTMVGTVLGRVSIPFLAIGTGSDVIVSLCTDNAGTPGTIITQTRIPASWINELSFISGTNVPGAPYAPIVNTTGSPLALAQFNAFRMNGFQNKPWPYPSVLAGAAPAASAYYGNYLYLLGGVNSSTAVANVFSAFCDNAGNMSPPVPQPALPQPADGSGKAVTLLDAATGGPVLVQAGGGASFLGATVSTVNTAAINPSTGALSAWSAQTALPYTVQSQGMAAYNGFVYVIGGVTTGGPNPRADVVFAQVQNTQITAWTSTTPIPIPLQLTYCAASNGFLFVTGGADASLTNQNVFWWAQINADGSLGPWVTGPQFPAAGDNLDAMPYGGPLGVITQVSNINTMGVTPNGLDIGWTNQSGGGGGEFTAFVQIGPATLQYYGASTFGSYNTQAFTLMPNISVPLPATGLTNGALYHILMQSPTNDLNNYVTMAYDSGTVFPGNPKTLHRAKGGSTWVSDAASSVPLTVYDQTVTGPVWHTWEDNGARISTLAYATTPDQRLVGILEGVEQPGPVLNQNPTFTSGMAPWGGANGTSVQSNTFTHGGLPFSARFTPVGGNGQAYIESELVSILLNHTYSGSAWFYSPTGWTDCEIIINWYNSSGFSGGFISSSTGASTNVPANTWTHLTVSGSPPTNAVFGTVGVYERSTPPNTAVFYASAVTLQDASGPMLGTVTEVNWSGTWPGQVYPPLGMTQLA